MYSGGGIIPNMRVPAQPIRRGGSWGYLAGSWGYVAGSLRETTLHFIDIHNFSLDKMKQLCSNDVFFINYEFGRYQSDNP